MNRRAPALPSPGAFGVEGAHIFSAPPPGNPLEKATNMTTTTTKKKMIAITMSERAPLKLDPELWPLIASADTHDGAVECQANREWAIKVREHEDGRRVVYGWVCRGNGGMPIGYRGASGGFLLDAPSASDPAARERHEADTIRAIRRVAGIIGDDQLGDECISDLPAVELV